MNRREQRRKRERETLLPALSALIANISPQDDTSAPLRYLKAFSTLHPLDGDSGDNVHVIEGDGLSRLCKELGSGICEKDVLAVARRVPRSQSTPERIDVTELCFAIAQATAPVNVHERRRNVGSVAPLDENAPLIKYYAKDRFASLLGCVSPEDIQLEWQKFFSCLSSPLPMTLRVHCNERVLKHIALEFLLHDPMLREVVQSITPLLPPRIGLYGCSHDLYHKKSRAEYICRTLHAASAVSFQETVSVLPVMVADIQPQHAVLDMCAAPGSKTLQVLDEMLQYGWSTSAVSQGVVIVNEKDRVKATQILPSRLKRFHAPNAICTRCDASQWPRIFYSSEEGPSYAEKRFDRIICDVPCSGDGTVRKEPASASSWSSGYVKSLFPTQKALLRRGLDLLREGGILVYSTCSMNPKEDEEVVCAGLELFGDTIELLDVNAILREKGAVLHSIGGVVSPNVDHLQKAILPSTFDGRKVLRILPHRDDTGGFFVACFRKRSLPDLAPPLTLYEKLNHWTKGKFWAPVGRHDSEWCNIVAFYGIDPDCTDTFQYYSTTLENKDQQLVGAGLVPLYHLNPNGAACRRIVLVTVATARMLFKTRPYKGPGVEIVSVGVRAFEAYDDRFLLNAQCRWRAVVESASYLAPCMRTRKIVLDVANHPELVRQLLSNGFIWLQDYWRVILHRTSVVTTTTTANSNNDNNCSIDNKGTSFVDVATDVLPLVRSDGPLHTLLTSTAWMQPSTQGICEMLAENVLVGGVLVGLVGGKLAGEEGPWWLSATLSSSKLELAVDASLRAFGLLAFLGVDSA
ncbi:putative methyltransferase [Trypanosoma rangeli]|uniref:Putative methyltransferase n=1 Tax=Trypanosoma rangeli TaxID=5698 RepID=A0A3R7M922_TRYRA|nr:putative methyltransferase [Trypanosoma rangeli]RNF11259.1 putative methyltransferase [Trypanosoma rangeli]|eukprot:RNF11259.1 putative methyltransferase [Trypanosoma rangeli]